MLAIKLSPTCSHLESPDGVVASTYVLEENSACINITTSYCPIEIISEIVRKALPNIVNAANPRHIKIVKELNTVAQEWFLCAIHHIIYKASTRCTGDQREEVTATDIMWSIMSLSHTDYYHWDYRIWLEYESVKANPMEKSAFHRFLVELGMDPLIASKELSKAASMEKDLPSFCKKVSQEGKHLVLKWVTHIALKTMEKAISTCEEEEGVSANVRIDDFFLSLHDIRTEDLLYPQEVCTQQCGTVVMDKEARKVIEIEKPLPPLPADLIELEILPRLPYHTTLSFKRVCKRWKDFISSGEFFSLHQGLNHTNLSLGILNCDMLIKSDLLNKEVNVKLTKINGKCFSSYKDMYLCDSSCGLLCFGNDTISGDECTWSFAICNPLTGDWSTVSPPPSHSPAKYYWGLPRMTVNTCTASHSYKLVLPFFKDHRLSFQVFSSETGEWKLVSNAKSPQIEIPEAIESWISHYVEGVLYWQPVSEEYLVWLDPVRDVAGLLSLPSGCRHGVLGSLDGRVSGGRRMICYVRLKLEEGKGEAYALVGMEHWNKLFAFDFVHLCATDLTLLPFNVGEILLFWVNGTHLWAWNISTRRWTEVGSTLVSKIRCPLFPYNASLLPVPTIKSSPRDSKKNLDNFKEGSQAVAISKLQASAIVSSSARSPMLKVMAEQKREGLDQEVEGLIIPCQTR